MPKKILLFVILLGSIIFFYFLWSAKIARQKSDHILEKFKEVNNSFKENNDSLTSKKSADAINVELIQSNFSIASITTETILYIDSLQEILANKTPPPNLKLQPILSKGQIEKLKEKLLAFNAAIISSRKNFSDTLNLGKVTKGKRLVSWEVYYFDNTTTEAAYTYLVYIRNRILKIQDTIVHVE